jgi:S1-C subfamily serine protease
VRSPVPDGTAEVAELVRRLKGLDYKVMLLDFFIGELGDNLSVAEIIEALRFLSNVGEILYFGTENDDILCRYVILSRNWMTSALLCILRNEMQRDLAETRNLMNLQGYYTDERYTEHVITKVLAGAPASRCPLLSNCDARMLWRYMSFMREAADRLSELTDSTTSTPTMFYFLERLLVHCGIFMPLEAAGQGLELSEVFFVPSLLPQEIPDHIWTYRSREAYMTTLCHTWLFRDGVNASLMDRLIVAVLCDVYKFTREVSRSATRSPPHRIFTSPFSQDSLHDFVEVRVHHVICWKSSLLVKLGTVFKDQETTELRESFVEVLVTIADHKSPYRVASDIMHTNQQRVVVSGKGQVGHHGYRLWNGGYKTVVDSVRRFLSSYSNVEQQVVCPDCLARASAQSAATWTWDSLQGTLKNGSYTRCMHGHEVHRSLICGETKTEDAPPNPIERFIFPVKVSDLFPGIVLVGLWDVVEKRFLSVGSGFVIDKKLGLVVTAAHVLFNMKDRARFGTPFYGREGAKVAIGIVESNTSDSCLDCENSDAVESKGSKPGSLCNPAAFRYFAKVVAEDSRYVDACVLQISSRLTRDVHETGVGTLDLPVNAVYDFYGEHLRALELTTMYQQEEPVRILGFNQRRPINRSADFAFGCINYLFQESAPDDARSSTDSGVGATAFTFQPRQELVVRCTTRPGHSGGPCVNGDGQVIGILSRADPVDRQQCYVVPSSELKPLVMEAKKICSRPAGYRKTPTM